MTALSVCVKWLEGLLLGQSRPIGVLLSAHPQSTSEEDERREVMTMCARLEVENVPAMLENLHVAHRYVRHNLSDSHDRNKMYYDRKAKPVSFKAGDMVYFNDPSDTSSKLSSRWKPFYRIVKALSDVTFVIKNQLEGGTKIVNAQNIRLADPDTRWQSVSTEPSSINSKYEQKQKSYIPVHVPSPIPLRVQPPRRSKYSAADMYIVQ